MTINLEVKGIVAKLLAQENLLVEHRQIQTAQFDVDTRVLTLPIWDKATDTIFDLLVAHEVGHALFTPNEDWEEKSNAPQVFINVVEDVRIEKLIKRRFPGLTKTFYKGYGELQELNFFEIETDCVSKMNLADRINLYFKIGSFLDIQFSSEEQFFVNLIDQCETFEDVLQASELLYEYCKKEHEKEQELTNLIDDIENQIEGDDVSNIENTIDNSSQQNLEEELSEDEDINNGRQVSSENISVDTMNNLSENLRSLIDLNRRDIKYIECPDIPLNEVVIKNSVIVKHLEGFWNMIYQEQEMKDMYVNKAKGEYQKYKTSSQKEVNYLVKEFECKKSADSYARASTCNTGVLDCTKLHSYKYNEDIFKKITTFADGKNHGLIFVLDWSGSMNNVLGSTVKQLLNLVWFCRKVKIPFKVYGFTNAWYNSINSIQEVQSLLKNPIKNTFWIDKYFRMLEFLDSNCNAQEFERQCINFWCLVTAVSQDLPGHVDCPSSFQLSGTPLNEALFSLHKILPTFKQQHKLQKLHTIILTDGESNNTCYASERYGKDNKKHIISYSIRSDNYYLRDRKLRTTYKLGHRHTIPILKNLSDNYPDVNFIGIRIASTADLGRFLREYTFDASKSNSVFQNDIDKIQSQFKKEKSISAYIPSFTKFFVISSSNLYEDTKFEVEEGAKKSTIRAAFRKSLSKSKFNRKILSEFVTFIS